jgi:hypothetical protein
MSLNPGEYWINNMPFNDLTVAGLVNPDIGTYKLLSGQSLTFTAVPNFGYVFDYWLLSDFETSQWEPPEGVTYYDWILSGNDRKKVAVNPITIKVGGVDETKFNETYRIWWLNAHFKKLA